MRCIVSTAGEGRVVVTHPTVEFVKMLTHGGAPEGYFSPEMTRDGQIASMVARGIREDVAVKWMNGIMCGGYTDAEAYELIRDRDTKPEWTAKELWDRSEIPADRWFRDAWFRGHNAGPISIHLGRAKAVQFKRIKAAIVETNLRRLDDFDLAPIECDEVSLRSRIAKCTEELELRSVWPDALHG